MNPIVLDAGALIALERNDRAMWSALKLAAIAGTDVLVPSAALAQVWRAKASQVHLSRALNHCVIASFDTIARAVGELCGRARISDVCDAQVAIVASAHADVLYTSDPADMRRLLQLLGARRPMIVRC
jgi:hypothetical protein